MIALSVFTVRSASSRTSQGRRFRSHVYLRLFPFVILAGTCFASEAAPADASASATRYLPNGLRIELQERHNTPLVAIDLWVQAGSREEAPDERGSAHFLEHTLFKGTTSRASGETDFAIETLGGVLDASTGADYAHFDTTVAPAHVAAALKILADAAQNATLPPVEIERERSVILTELARRNASGYLVLQDLLYSQAFTNGPYGHSPGGSPAEIAALDRSTIVSFYHRCYTPVRCTLVLVGDIDPDTSWADAVSAFGSWQDSAAVRRTPASVSDAHPSLLPSRPLTLPAPDSVDRVGLAFIGPRSSDGDSVCEAAVVAALLGSPELGRFRVPALYNTQAQASFAPRLEAGLFVVTAEIPRAHRWPDETLSSGVRAKSIQADLMRCVQSLFNTAPSLGEVAAARQQVLSALRTRTETDEGLADELGRSIATHGIGPAEFQKMLEEIGPADIVSFSRKYLAAQFAIGVQLKRKTDSD